MRHRLGNTQPFFSESPAISKCTQLRMAIGKLGTGVHGRKPTGQGDDTDVIAAPCPIEECHSLPEAVDRPTIVALGQVGQAEMEVRLRLQDNLPTGCSERESTLGSGDGLVIRAHGAEIE
jgi:hypothetical protein